jgi:hypothetical protein
MNAVRSARLPRCIHEFLSVPNAINRGFSFAVLAHTLLSHAFMPTALIDDRSAGVGPLV